MDFLKCPSSVKALAAEIINAVDAYWSRKISEKELKEILLYWANNEGLKLFQAEDFNPTIKQRVGKRRLEVVNKFLEGLQTKF